MPPEGFEPAIPANEQPQTHAVDRVVSVIGTICKQLYEILSSRYIASKTVELYELQPAFRICSLKFWRVRKEIYIKIYINIAPTCFSLRPLSGSLH